MFFLASTTYLAYIFYWRFYKKDIPAFLHQVYYSYRDSGASKTKHPKMLEIVNIPVVILLFISFLGFFDPFFSNRVNWVFVSSVMWLTFVMLITHFLNLKFAHYLTTVKENEDKQRLKQVYGSKGWATEDQISKVLSNSRTKDGAPVGLHIGHGWHWYGKGHLLCVGGAGSGKGISVILPAILSDSFVNGGISLVCLDPKGENAAIAAPFLRRMGYDVQVVNPFNIHEIANLGNSRWNPFDLIEPHEVKKMCDVLAFSLHNRQGSGDGSFFDNKCRNYISLYMRYAMHTGNGNMNYVYQSLQLPGQKRKELLAKMAVDESFSGASEADNILEGLMGQTSKTEENIFGTIQEAINILGDDALRLSLSRSDFDMRDIAQKPTAIFLCIRHDELRYYSAWVRMFTDFLLKTLTVHYNPHRKVVVLLDEFAQLGYVNEFKNSPAILRGYNITLWPIVQELGQLKSIYGDSWETFISNAVIKHWLGGSMDNTTAHYIEQRMPNDVRFVGKNSDGSHKEIQTKLMNASEIMSMQGMICEVTGLDRPITFNKVPYWKLPFAKNNASANPFY